MELQIQAATYVLTALIVFFSFVFIICWVKNRFDLIDIAWGVAFVLAAVVSLFFGRPGALQYIVTSLVVLWAIRLVIAIALRLLHSKEDSRYTEMRQKWGKYTIVNMYTRVFLVQAVLATIISLSVVFINTSVSVINLLLVVGLALWAIGFLFETIGDWQLRRFLSDPANKGKLMTGGLWRYTRHPNYFGEATQWWGIFVIALSVPYGWVTIIAPATITFLLLFVSGVPLTEKHFENKPGWTEYKRRTSSFLPLPPRA